MYHLRGKRVTDQQRDAAPSLPPTPNPNPNPTNNSAQKEKKARRGKRADPFPLHHRLPHAPVHPSLLPKPSSENTHTLDSNCKAPSCAKHKKRRRDTRPPGHIERLSRLTREEGLSQSPKRTEFHQRR
ncbi:hypothetical protein CONLIGDRAFT_638416 [Coniochaeta ligniaria NRRL 30616]|uniref:Uncharacterized protein n=1 Tax=Coniochaeta ligniaria NRRL 30616 TaxID=1408157 RepID=A0A1J7I489_9PEZI|nr:hypothetical protein CONLIGDRAFT_638416 [Coniochaeta ligniaria NRRL 30616]